MKRFLLLYSLVSVLSIAAQGQTTAKAAGMGSLSSIHIDNNSLFNNPAGLAAQKNISFLANTEQYYLLDGVNKSSLGAAIPTGFGAFGLIVHNFGFSEFRQQKLGLTYTRKLFRQLFIGGQINYFQTRISEYGSSGQVSFEVGLQAKLTKEFLIGTYISNPYQNDNLENSKLPTLFQIGLAYFVSEKIITGVELEKDIDFAMRIKYGLEYKVLEKIYVRTGFSSNPTNFHMGIGLKLSEKLMLDIGNKYDPSLGLTPSLSTGYLFIK